MLEKDVIVKSFPSNVDVLHVRTWAARVEPADFMTILERYHQPIRQACLIIESESGKR